MSRKRLCRAAAVAPIVAAMSVTAPAESPRPAPATGAAGVLQPFVDSHVLAGAVTLVASRDKVLSLEAVGWADVAARKPMTADSLFWVASQSKPITAAALMILVDEGKVSVDDPVEKYLPEFKGQMVQAEKGAALPERNPLHKLSRHLMAGNRRRIGSQSMDAP